MTQYTIRVRGEKYLWGSAGLKFNLDVPMLMVVRVDLFGEPISLFTETKDGLGSRVPFGTLGPGESFTLSLQTLRGVIARCDLNSEVSCTLVPHSGASV